METPAAYGVTMLVTPSTVPTTPTLASLLREFEAQANALLLAAGYPAVQAQVGASILPSGIYFTVSAPDPTTVFYDNLSFGIAPTAEEALNSFGQRLQAVALVKEAA